MYHYVRNPEMTPYPGIKSIREEAFISQVDNLQKQYEFVDLEKMLDFLNGKYKPSKDLCVLTFDDGLHEHGGFVTDVLADRGIQGMFFIPTACIKDNIVLPVHQNHFLLASLDFDYYQKTFIENLHEYYPSLNLEVDKNKVAKTYRWDNEAVASFKYLINYILERPVRNHILSTVFASEFGDESSFAKELYVSWNTVVEMQNKGMIIGGHSHTHQVLAHLSDEEQANEIKSSSKLIREHTKLQHHYPFSYPFGKQTTFNNKTISLLKEYGFDCGFTTVVDDVMSGSDIYQISRVDTKDVV